MNSNEQVEIDPRLVNMMNELVFKNNYFNQQNFVFCKVCNEAWKLKYSNLNLPVPAVNLNSAKNKRGNYSSQGCTTYKLTKLTGHLGTPPHTTNEKLLDFFEMGENKDNCNVTTSSSRFVCVFFF